MFQATNARLDSNVVRSNPLLRCVAVRRSAPLRVRGAARQTGTTNFLTFANSNYAILENIKSGTAAEWFIAIAACEPALVSVPLRATT